MAVKFYAERNHKGDSNDEDLARAIQDSLNMNPYTPYNPYAPSQAQPRGHRLASHHFIEHLVYLYLMPKQQWRPCLCCRVCGGCKHEIGHGHYLSCMGIYWHPQCFRCCSCRHPIRETEVGILHFLLSRKCVWVSSEIIMPFLVSVFQFTLLGTDPYHKLCYKELHHPKCDVCLQFVRLSLNSE